MLPGEHSSVDGREKQDNQTKGSAPLKSAQEILCTSDPVNRGNTIPADLISTQPLPAAAPPAAEASQEAAVFKKPRGHPHKPACPRCGLAVPDHRISPLSPSLSRLQASKLSVHSGSSRRSGSSSTRSHRTAATPADSCFHLLLACLSCQGSVLLLGLLEACSCCLYALCSSCCDACARCCSAVQEAPVEELNCHAHCHSVLFESCCEPTECLEFCLECCEICHRS
ncbi:myoD family inhibitor domain-containing protein-like isoform X1 [Stegastes partitus]|uniref:MyoD family inhibitor domain-containing protein-like isoform X1 n=1 Tax=Stegastes partitus TaxID=144197 RepID=A0A9Y4N3N2_9TELE|nr:PREDICTED: myoD family inhibitor domain-containing protein-like isoform X1 [Stegastes partitus]